MSDLERVARAVCAVLHGTADGYDVWDAIGETDRQKCRQIAAAAMRETRLIDAEAAIAAGHRSVVACARLGAWMSAALDDPNVCDAMKADISEWFSAGEPINEHLAALVAARAGGDND
jgi:hypothetical protein